MKKLLLTIFFALIFVVAFSQARLGYSASDIRTEFQESRYKLKSSYTDTGIYYITIRIENASVVYYFNSDRICTLTCIIPDNQGALNFYVELYNKMYVIVSSTNWKMYSANGISNITLVYPEEGGYYFTWTID